MSEEKVSLSNPPNQPRPGDVGFVPPASAVPLPSKGKIYPTGTSIHGAELLEIRAMTARDEDILTSRALLKQGKAISTLLRSCLVDKTIDPEQMVAGDRNALLVAIRITGYGSDYSVQVECPACGEGTKHEFDLSKLEIKPLGIEPAVPGQNVFTFKLPISRRDVQFKLLTGADEKELSTTLERTRKATGGLESAVTTKLICSVLSIGGESDRAKLAQLIRDMPARDSRDLRNYIEEISPGVKMSQEFTCGSCGESMEVDVPMGTEFFWPQ